MNVLNILIAVLVLYVIYKSISLAVAFIGKKADKKLQENAEKYLNDAFDGRETIVYEVADSGTLKFGQVVSGAEQRGYALHAQNQDNASMTTLVFKKAV